MKLFTRILPTISFIFLLALPVVIFADDVGCAQHPTYIPSLNDIQKKKLIKEVNDNELISDPSDYHAYLFNDHGQQYAMITYHEIASSDNSLFIYPYKKNSHNEWDALATITLAIGDNDIMDNNYTYDTYTNELTGKDEFLTQICGNTYLSLIVKDATTHHVYQWNNTNMSANESCDKNFTDYQRFLFHGLYTQQLYTAAANQQNEYLARCKIDPQTFLWMKNDIALAQLKANNLIDANITLNEVTTNPDLQNISPSLKNAINFNKNIYQEKSKQSVILDKPLGKTAFSWMLDKKAWDIADTVDMFPSSTMMKLSELPSQIVPDISANLLYSSNNQAKQSLKQYLYTAFGKGIITNDNNKNRYIIISMDPGVSHDDDHDGELTDQSVEQPFYWIDTQTGTSVVGSFIRDQGLYITSRNYSSTTIPVQVKQDLANFYENIWDQKAFDLPIHFYDIEAKKNIDLPSNWLRV